MSRTSNTRPRSFLLTAIGLLLVLAPSASSCRANGSEGPTGGETHFLTRCGGPDACGSALGCTCGVCTLACSADSDCAKFHGAACFSDAVAGDASSCQSSGTGRCDVRCVADEDCHGLSPSHRCEAGFCRVGEVDAGLAGAGGGDSTGQGGAGACQHGDVSGNEVVFLGDTFIAATHQITAEVEQLAREAGALPAGERYRDESTMTTNALALTGHQILSQYQRAVEDAPIKVVIMDGGGSDLLLGRCDQATAACPIVADAAAAAQQLFAQMASDGVSDVVYFFYPDAEDTDLRARVDALRPLIRDACAAAPVPCVFLDLRPAFADHSEYLAADGLNPSADGASATARVIWDAMAQACIAQ
jgi:hypothetical protein